MPASWAAQHTTVCLICDLVWKSGLSPILKLLEMTVLIFSVLELANGCSYIYQLFTHFTHIHYLQNHLLYKQWTAKFPAILDSFLLGVDCIRQAPILVGGMDQRQARQWFFKNERGKCMDALGQVIGHSGLKPKGNLLHWGLFYITGL